MTRPRSGPRPRLSQADAEQLAEIVRAFTAVKGYPPSVRDVQAALGLQSSSVMRRLELAREAGLVTWERGHTRTLRAVDL